MEAAPARGSGKKLVRGVRLSLFAPEWDRPCALCERYDYDKDGNVRRLPDGSPVPRPKIGNQSAPTPCQACAKPPKWAKEQGKDWKELRSLADEMSDENRRAYQFYRECKAVGHFPDDAIVRWYAAIVRDVEDDFAKEPIRNNTAAVLSLITLLTMKFRR